jgi:hypothetical protein
MAYRFTLLLAVVAFYAGMTEAKELKLLSFSFEIPEHWAVQEMGQTAVMATGRPDLTSSLPFIMVEACTPTGERKCSAPPLRRTPHPEAPKGGDCDQLVVQDIARTDGIKETRWFALPQTS